MSTPLPEHLLRHTAGSAPDPLLIQSLAGRNADDERLAAQTARRRVAGKLLSEQEQKCEKRRKRAIAVMVSLGVLILLSPAIWNSAEDLIEDGHFGDLGSQFKLLFLLLFPALLAALIAGWRSGQNAPQGKRNL
jgi:hypothetical protein